MHALMQACMHARMHYILDKAWCRVPDNWLPPVEDQRAVVEVKRKVQHREHGCC